MSNCSGLPSNDLQVGGFKMRYFSDTIFTVLFAETTTPQIDYTWGNGAPLSTMTTGNYFSITAYGYIKADFTGWYWFRITAGQTARLWVNRQLLIDSTSDFTSQIYLIANQFYEVDIEVVNNGGYGYLNLYWRGPNSYFELVPPQNMYYYNRLCNCYVDPVTSLVCGGIGQGFCMNSVCGCRAIYSGSECTQLKCRNDECLGSDKCCQPALPYPRF